MLPGESVASAGAVCMAAGCHAKGAWRCAYRDARGRWCRTWWCAGHCVVAAGRAHCRRHAAVAALLANSPFPPPAPDVASRAASLVAWMHREIDADLSRLLQRLATERGGSTVLDPLQVMTRPGRGRCWRSAWKLADHRGVLTSLVVEVAESREDEVVASVDTMPVGHGVPPWIERRRIGSVLDSAQEDSERRAFTQAIGRSMEVVATGHETAWDG